jgi:serine/threonine-protein kinase
MAVETELLPDRYSGAARIGRGAMGDIYCATDTMLGRVVAIKLLARRYAEDVAIRARFTREALAAARLSAAPHVVTIYDVGEWGGRPYIVMEYLRGGSLADVLERDGAQPPGRALEWLEQAARALDAAHRSGVVHRDVKPANLLLDDAGSVYVADFGIASAAGMDSLTQTGTVLGTAGYLAPEQAQGRRADAASDRYAFAVVAWELLTGERPFASDSITAEAAAHVNRPVPSVCERSPALPCELDPVFERALAKNPAARYSTCAEFVADLRGALDAAAGRTHVLAAPASPPYLPPRRRSSWLYPFLAVAAVAALGGGLAAALLAHHSSSAGRQSPPQPTITTVTQGTTVVQTVTVPAPAPAQTTPAAAPPAPVTTASTSSDPHTLNDQAWALMQRGDFADALPLLQRAVPALAGAGPSDPYEAYANFNLGYTLVQLGRCNDAVPYLEHAKALEPDRHEVGDELKAARRCSA